MGILQTIKKAAVHASKAEHPVRFLTAQVLSPPPNLEIMLENNPKMVYPAEHIIVPEALTTYEVSILLNGVMTTGTIHNELKTGDEIMVASVEGATFYFVLDRISKGG